MAVAGMAVAGDVGMLRWWRVMRMAVMMRV